MGNNLFGVKSLFAFEVGQLNATKKTAKLRFWLKGTSIGSFTKEGELIDSVKAFQKFLHNKESYYDHKFEKMTTKQIAHYFLESLVLVSGTDEDKKEAQKRAQFDLFFGKQFSNTFGFNTILYRDGIVIFILYRGDINKVKRLEVPFHDFQYAFDKYYAFCVTNEVV